MRAAQCADPWGPASLQHQPHIVGVSGELGISLCPWPPLPASTGPPNFLFTDGIAEAGLGACLSGPSSREEIKRLPMPTFTIHF